MLAEINGLNDLGAEIFSPILEGMTAEEVAEKCKKTVESILVAAGVKP